MKQRITLEQLNELSKEDKIKLRHWWKPDDGDWFVINNENSKWTSLFYEEKTDRVVYSNEYYEPKQNCLPLLSIGQMIDFIEEKNELLVRTDSYDVLDYKTLHWKVNVGLCNTLWEMVKKLI